MSIVGAVLGSDKALATADNVVNKISSAVDYAFFTNQEKAELAFKHAELWLRVQEVTANESTAKAITRRILAVLILSAFIFLILGAAVVYKFDKEWAEFMIRCAGMLATLAGAVGIFYFGYYGAQQIASVFRGKEPQGTTLKTNENRDSNR